MIKVGELRVEFFKNQFSTGLALKSSFSILAMCSSIAIADIRLKFEAIELVDVGSFEKCKNFVEKCTNFVDFENFAPVMKS